ncbi:LytR family transcriptional regulator [Nocardioides dongxiaopingii]|uniref:LCP family protein n=1 Tax=Nocardioides TaxID=1839 RepID=UPI0010C762B1|nr:MULTISPECIES: LCP family protein [Nocardioides]QCW50249.1 LytR family transcriptional regulator [Nocardioides sp. S-1144]
MTDRPGNGGPQDGPEFGWLYGGNRNPDRPPGQPADEPPPEATRMMPVQQRPEPTAARPTTPRPVQPAPTPYDAPPQQPLTPAGPPVPPGPGEPSRRGGGGGFWARRVRRPRFWIRTVLVLLLLWLVYTVAVPFVTWRSADQVAFEPDGDRPAEQDGTTYLLVGSDSRAGLSAEERKELSTGNPKSELTDTIMLLHTGDGPSVLLSVPRDSIVDMPGYGQGKINSAYSRGGPELLVQTLENETGIRIDKYVEIGLGGVADVVDAVGGIEVCPKERIQDPLAGLKISKGCQEVDGATALAYSRSRKQSTLGDLARVERQREVIGAIGDKVLSPWSVANPVRWWKLNRAVPTFFGFGEGTSSIDAGRWALAMTKTGTGDNLTCTMPVTSPSAETWDRDRADPLFQAIIDDSTGDITKAQCTPNGIPRP